LGVVANGRRGWRRPASSRYALLQLLRFGAPSQQERERDRCTDPDRRVAQHSPRSPARAHSRSSCDLLGIPTLAPWVCARNSSITTIGSSRTAPIWQRGRAR